MNIYDGCLSNDIRLIATKDKEFYEVLEEFQNDILAQGKKVVFVEWNTSVTSGARAVIYEDRVPKIMQEYKYRYVKINGVWTRNCLLGYCDKCGEYKELICHSREGHTCEDCCKFEL